MRYYNLQGPPNLNFPKPLFLGEGLDIWSPFAGSSVCRPKANTTSTETYACRGCSFCTCMSRGVGRTRLCIKPSTWSKQLGLLTITLIILIGLSALQLILDLVSQHKRLTQTTKSDRLWARPVALGEWPPAFSRTHYPLLSPPWPTNGEVGIRSQFLLLLGQRVRNTSPMPPPYWEAIPPVKTLITGQVTKLTTISPGRSRLI